LEYSNESAGKVELPLSKYIPHNFDNLVKNYLKSVKLFNDIDKLKEPVLLWNNDAYSGMIKAYNYFTNNSKFVFPFNDISIYSILGLNSISSRSSMIDILRKLTAIIGNYQNELQERNSIFNATNSILVSVDPTIHKDNLYYIFRGFLLLTYQPEYTLDNIIRILKEEAATHEQNVPALLLIGAYKGIENLNNELPSL
jgi:hypothetical protein